MRSILVFLLLSILICPVQSSIEAYPNKTNFIEGEKTFLLNTSQFSGNLLDVDLDNVDYIRLNLIFFSNITSNLFREVIYSYRLTFKEYTSSNQPFLDTQNTQIKPPDKIEILLPVSSVFSLFIDIELQTEIDVSELTIQYSLEFIDFPQIEVGEYLITNTLDTKINIPAKSIIGKTNSTYLILPPGITDMIDNSISKYVLIEFNLEYTSDHNTLQLSIMDNKKTLYDNIVSFNVTIENFYRIDIYNQGDTIDLSILSVTLKFFDINNTNFDKNVAGAITVFFLYTIPFLLIYKYHKKEKNL